MYKYNVSYKNFKLEINNNHQNWDTDMNEEFKFSHILIFGSISVLMIVIYFLLV